MSIDVKSNETRAVGWYALRWAQITDWYKAHKVPKGKQASIKKESEDFIEDKGKSPGVRNYAKHAIEDLDKPVIKDIEEKRLKEAVKESRGLLIKATTVFPFTLFPSTITIDRHKLTIIYRRFFRVEQTVSVPIENIKNIQADLDIFFGSITITSDHFINNTQEVRFLPREDAKKIQKLVQGAMVAVSEEIDVSKVDADKLIKLLEKLGAAHNVS